MHSDSGKFNGYNFTNDTNCSYLVLELDSSAIILNHQVEIINQNPDSAFVPFHMRRVDEMLSIYYDITSKITLSEYLKRKRLSKKELLDLLRSITKNLMMHSNYLLELSDYLLDKDFIFINPATAEASMVYIPISCDGDATEEYKTFLKDLVVNSASVDDNARDNYLQRILSYLKAETFSLADFNRLIAELRNSGGVYRERTAMEEAAASYAPVEREFANVVEGSAVISKRVIYIVLLQLMIVLSAAISCLVLVSRSMADIVSISGILVVASALDVLILNRLKGMKNKQVKKAEPEFSTYKSIYRTVSKTPDVLESCNTVMISEAPGHDRPYLEGLGVHRGERIVINKDKFIIGRLGSMVDYVMQGGTIGKLHAEISASKDVYCIRDLNSKNGTYINDVRIPSNKECEIKDSDRIRFSNLEYVFKQQNML